MWRRFPFAGLEKGEGMAIVGTRWYGWYLVRRCSKCKNPITVGQKYDHYGICVHCGYRGHGSGATVVSTTDHARRNQYRTFLGVRYGKPIDYEEKAL